MIAMEKLPIIILILNSYQAFLFALLFFTNARRCRARTTLGFFFLFLGFHFSFELLFRISPDQLYVYAEFFTLPVAVILMPLFYIYLRLLTESEPLPLKAFKRHFNSAFLVLIVYAPLYGFMSPQARAEYFMLPYSAFFSKSLLSYPAAGMVLLVLFIIVPIQVVFYYIKIHNVLRCYHNNIQDQFSSISRISLNWIKVCATVFFTYSMISLILLIFWEIHAEFVYYCCSLPFFALVAIFGMIQEGAFRQNFEVQQNQLSSIETSNEAGKILSYSDRKEELGRAILQLFDDQKVFLKPELSINDLASALNSNKTCVSRALRDVFGSNFYLFVNMYRIEKAKELLLDPLSQLLSIDSIAAKSGFNSTSVFCSTFKKSVQMTPAQFRFVPIDTQ